ncbi:MAG: thiamine diphosphokinase [Oscillospiraceae bacterium]
MKAYIFCSATINNYEYLKKIDFSKALVVCADGGYEHAKTLGLVPNAIIGDSDSYLNEIPKEIEFYKYPKDKDFTDTNLCIDYVIKKDCRDITLIGGIGGRLDHEFSHFCFMKYALEREAKLKIIDEKNEVWMEKSDFNIIKNEKKYVSFFPYGGSVNELCISGLKYEVSNMTLECGSVQASSNEFLDKEAAHISFKSGTLLVMRCND